MYTEAEAKKRWCPFSRVAFIAEVAGATHNRAAGSADELYDATRCIGSACMAWRGGFSADNAGTRFTADHSGYCGLAGRP